MAASNFWQDRLITRLRAEQTQVLFGMIFNAAPNHPSFQLSPGVLDRSLLAIAASNSRFSWVGEPNRATIRERFLRNCTFTRTTPGSWMAPLHPALELIWSAARPGPTSTRTVRPN